MSRRSVSDGWAMIEAPSWLGGGKPGAWFKAADYKTRASGSVLHLRTDESYRHVEPKLVRVEHLYQTGVFDRLHGLACKAERVEVSLDDPRIAAEMTKLAAERSPELTLRLYRQQARLSMAGCTPEQLPQVAAEALLELEELMLADRTMKASSRVGMSLVSPKPALFYRTKLPSVMLRIANDPALQAGDLQSMQALMDSGQMIFAAAQGFYSGVSLMDVYIAPLLGCTSPSIWGIASHRSFGMLVTSLGRGVSGTMSRPGHRLELITPSVSTRMVAEPVPTQTLTNQFEALEWWVGALNRMFGVLTDYSNFIDGAGMYRPSRHLSDLATVDQLFRRISAIAVQHGQIDSQLALLFTCIDTLEALNGWDPLTMFSASHAKKTLDGLETEVPDQAKVTLLAVARRAVAALEQVQDGFFLAAQNGRPHVLLDDKPVPLEFAAAKYLYHLRNATHGHGGKGRKQQAEYAMLLANHTGSVEPPRVV